MGLNSGIESVTDRIRRRSAANRARHLDRVEEPGRSGPRRARIACGNLAHGFAACSAENKLALKGTERPNLAIVSSYNGMPELHKLTPVLGVLQDRGLQVALVTHGRMSGASGSVPSAIHLCPEAAAGGPIGRIRDGDIIRVDAQAGVLEAELDDAIGQLRAPAPAPSARNEYGTGRELFGLFRRHARSAEEGGSPIQEAPA